MGAASEPIIYSVGMVIALTLFLTASTASGDIIQDVFAQTDLHQARYESIARSYTMVSEGYNYNFTHSRAQTMVEGVSGEDYCTYTSTPKTIEYKDPSSKDLIMDNISIRTREMGIYDYCESRTAVLNSMYTTADFYYIVRFPPMAFSVNNPDTGNPGEIEYFSTYPESWF